jgi:hypothetical protein
MSSLVVLDYSQNETVLEKLKKKLPSCLTLASENDIDSQSTSCIVVTKIVLGSRGEIEAQKIVARLSLRFGDAHIIFVALRPGINFETNLNWNLKQCDFFEFSYYKDTDLIGDFQNFQESVKSHCESHERNYVMTSSNYQLTQRVALIDIAAKSDLIVELLDQLGNKDEVIIFHSHEDLLASKQTFSTIIVVGVIIGSRGENNSKYKVGLIQNSVKFIALRPGTNLSKLNWPSFQNTELYEFTYWNGKLNSDVDNNTELKRLKIDLNI